MKKEIVKIEKVLVQAEADMIPFVFEVEKLYNGGRGKSNALVLARDNALKHEGYIDGLKKALSILR